MAMAIRRRPMEKREMYWRRLYYYYYITILYTKVRIDVWGDILPP